MDNYSNHLGYVLAIESLIGGRQENQDDCDFRETPFGLLVVVCDGMGGGPAGKTASSMATQAIIDYVQNAPTTANAGTVLMEAVSSANMAVINAQRQDSTLLGMGTTCVALLLQGSTAYIIHVGDSRCYQLRKGKIQFRTNDHSFVAELVRNKTLTEEQARTAGNSNIITRAVGIKPKVQPELDTVSVKPGDRFALMSDGIWGTMPQPRLIEFLTQKQTAGEIVDEVTKFVDASGRNHGGKHDNLTLAIVDVPTKAEAKAAKEKEAQPLKTRRSDNQEKKEKTGSHHPDLLASIIAIAVLAAIIIVSYLLITSDDNPVVDTTEEVIGMSEETVEKITEAGEEKMEEATQAILQKFSDANSKAQNKAQGIELVDSLISVLDTIGDGGRSTFTPEQLNDRKTARQQNYKELVDMSRALYTLYHSDQQMKPQIETLYNKIIETESARILRNSIDNKYGCANAEVHDLVKQLHDMIAKIKDSRKTE